MIELVNFIMTIISHWPSICDFEWTY